MILVCHYHIISAKTNSTCKVRTVYLFYFVGSSKLDMVFVMDKSGSIGAHDFNLEKKFVEDLIEYFSVFPSKTRVAVVTYSTFVKMEFDFNKNINKECVRKGIQAIEYVFRMFNGLYSHNFIINIECLQPI